MFVFEFKCFLCVCVFAITCLIRLLSRHIVYFFLLVVVVVWFHNIFLGFGNWIFFLFFFLQTDNTQIYCEQPRRLAITTYTHTLNDGTSRIVVHPSTTIIIMITSMKQKKKKLMKCKMQIVYDNDDHTHTHTDIISSID